MLLTGLDSLDNKKNPFWVRLFYAYPVGTDDELLSAIVKSDVICNYLDIPLQHISKSVLKSMRRPFGAKGTRKLVEKIANEYPQIALRTTFIVGFPGETEEDVDELVEFVSKGHFTHVGVFTYSQEKEALSFSFDGQLDDATKEKRRARVMKAQQEVLKSKLEQKVGEREIVLVDGLHEESDLLLAARAYWQGPETDGMVIINEIPEDLDVDLKGKFVEVEYVEVAGYDLIARVLEP